MKKAGGFLIGLAVFVFCLGITGCNNKSGTQSQAGNTGAVPATPPADWRTAFNLYDDGTSVITVSSDDAGMDDCVTLNTIAFRGGTIVVGGVDVLGKRSLLSDSWLGYSKDMGRTWKVVDNNLRNIDFVLYGNGNFIAGGPDPDWNFSTLNSPDCVSWTANTNGNIFTNGIGTTSSGNGTFAAGDKWSLGVSTDGINWDAQDITFGDSDSAKICGIACGDTAVAAVAGTGELVCSQDMGKTWQTEPLFDGQLFAVAYGGGAFVAGGRASEDNPNNVFTSSDGVNWAGTSCVVDNVVVIAYGGKTFVAGGQSYTGGSVLSCSGDAGVTWQSAAGTFPADCHITCITYADAYFVAGDDSGNVYYSGDNGKSWEAVQVFNSTWRGNAINTIVFDGETFAALAGNGQISYTRAR